jgi:hypothetical protein
MALQYRSRVECEYVLERHSSFYAGTDATELVPRLPSPVVEA